MMPPQRDPFIDPMKPLPVCEKGHALICLFCSMEARQADPAVAKVTESAPTVVAQNALSPLASGGAPDLREYVEQFVNMRLFVEAYDGVAFDKARILAAIDKAQSALSSSVSPKGEQ